MGLVSKFWARLTQAPRYIFGPRRPFWVRSNTVVDEDTSMQVSAFNRGVIYISTQIAKLPWEVKDASNNIIVNPISLLLNLAPNDEMSAFTFRCLMLQQAIVHGNAYAEIERGVLGQPLALWPLYSTQMTMVRDESNRLVYRYQNTNGGVVSLQPRDVYHIKNFHTKDGISGQGVVAYGREVLGIQIAADEMASGIFHNGGIPSGVLTTTGRLSDEAYERLKKNWKEENSGRKAGGTTILEEGLKYEALNTDPEALQFLESRQFGVLEIARFLGLPPTKLFDVAAAKYANVENSNLEVATDTLDAWATSFEIEADIKLLNYRYGNRFTEIDLYSIFRGDMKSRSDYFKTMMGIGAITPNEIRNREGMSPYKGGEEYYIATNNLTPVSRMNEVIDAEIKSKTMPRTASPSDSGNKNNSNSDGSGDTSAELEKAAIHYLTQSK